MTAQLRYLAYLTEQPDALAAFYGRHLRFDEIQRSATGDVSLSDGVTKLSLFRVREDLGEAHMAVGPHHVGFAVESIEQIKARFRRLCPRGVMVPESGKQRGDIRIYDPECHPISLSQSGFGLDATPPREPRLRYLAIGALDPDALADFYVQVLGLRALDTAIPTGAGARATRRITDGNIVLAFYDYFAPPADGRARYGISRCGFDSQEGAHRAILEDPDGTPVILAKPETAGAEAWRV